MKTKNILITVLCVTAVILSLALLMMRSLDIHFNFSSYHSFEQGGYDFTFKGSFGNVRKLIIKQNDQKIAALPFKSSSDVFFTEFGYEAEFEDINGDGTDDLLLPRIIDEDGDKHMIAYIAQNDSFVYNDHLTDLPGLTSDGEFIYTEQTVKEIIPTEQENTPEYYERRHSIAKHCFINGNFVTLEERAITYYSENDYYSYSVYKYSEEHGEMMYDKEKWFDPNDLDKYPLNWD